MGEVCNINDGPDGVDPLGEGQVPLRVPLLGGTYDYVNESPVGVEPFVTYTGCADDGEKAACEKACAGRHAGYLEEIICSTDDVPTCVWVNGRQVCYVRLKCTCVWAGNGDR